MSTTRRSRGTRKVKNALSVSASRSTRSVLSSFSASDFITSTTVADYERDARAAICAAVEGVYNNKLRLFYNVEVMDTKDKKDKTDDKGQPTFEQTRRACEEAKYMANKVKSLQNLLTSLARVGGRRKDDGEYARNTKMDKAFVKTVHLVHQMMITCILLQATTNSTPSDSDSDSGLAQKHHGFIVQAVHRAGYTEHAQDLERPCQFDAFVQATSLVYEQPWGGDHFDDDCTGARAQFQLYMAMVNKIVRSCLVTPKKGSARALTELSMESYHFHAQITAFKLNPEAEQRVSAAMQKRSGLAMCPLQKDDKTAEHGDNKKTTPEQLAKK